jgi:hypothetical protein
MRVDNTESKPFDPLKKTRNMLIGVKDTVDAAEMKDSYINIEHRQAELLSFATQMTIKKFHKEGGDINQLKEKIYDEKTLGKISDNIEIAYSSEEFKGKGFSEWLTNDSKAQVLRVAENYLDVVRQMSDEMGDLKEGEDLTEHPIVPHSSLGMAKDFRNGRLKDKLSVLTPKKYHYSQNFDRGVQAVTKALGLSSNLVTFDEIEFYRL